MKKISKIKPSASHFLVVSSQQKEKEKAEKKAQMRICFLVLFATLHLLWEKLEIMN